MEEQQKIVHPVATKIIIVCLCLFSVFAIIASVYILFSDSIGSRTVSEVESEGMFRSYINTHINQIHPSRPAAGSEWAVTHLDFDSANFAHVIASDGVRSTSLEVIFVVRGRQILILKVNDVTSRLLLDAQLALLRFLNFLHIQSYDEAAKLYNGSTDRLKDLDPMGDTASQLKAYCAQVSPIGSCPRFEIEKAVDDSSKGVFAFTVRYMAADGSTIKTQDNRTSFTVLVRQSVDGKLEVMTLPFD